MMGFTLVRFVVVVAGENWRGLLLQAKQFAVGLAKTLV
jgi:hypothetical protein